MNIPESFWVPGLMPIQFLLVFALAFFVFIAVQSLLTRVNQRVTSFWQAISVWFTGYAILKFVVVPPLPSSLLYQYIAVITVATFVWVSATEPSWNECKHTVLSLLGGTTRGYRVARALCFIALPTVFGLAIHNHLVPRFEDPIELRTVDPAPPASILVDGERFALQEERNPFRVDAIGQYSDTVQQQYLDVDPWNSDAIPYMRYVREGGVLYFQECHFCHGAALDGLGVFSYAIIPRALNFLDPGTIAQHQEVYVFWKTYVGGRGMPREAFPWALTAPAFQEHLSSRDIWKVILFLYWFTGWEPRTWD
jgi:hypothetical protein